MNNSMGRGRIITLIILCIAGLLLSSELMYIFYKNNFIMGGVPPSFCSVSATIDCDGVAKTSYSMFLGVPLALWGALLYFALLFLTVCELLKSKFKEAKNFLVKFIYGIFPNPRSYIATLGILSFSISMLLAFISIFKIGKVCALCFVTYLIDLIIAFCAKSQGSFFLKDIKVTAKDFIQGAKKYPWALAAVIILGASTLTYTTISNVFSPNTTKMKLTKEFQEMKINPYAAEGNLLGKEGGKIQVYLYSDFMCPYCRVTNIMIHKIVKENPDVEVHHMNFPLDTTCNPSVGHTMHPGACEVAKWALAAKEQGNYWGMVNALYNNLPNSEEQVLEIAKNIGLDTNRLREDAHSDAINDVLNKQVEMAKNSFVAGTPSMRVNGIMYMGGMSYPDLKSVIKKAKREQ